MASRPDTRSTPPAEARHRLPLGRSGRRIGYGRRLRLLLALLSLPLFACVLWLLQSLSANGTVTLIALLFTALSWAWLEASVANHFLRPLQTLSNVVAALRESDYSFRARGARRGDPLGDLALEINALAADLQRERVASIESAALVQRILQVLQAPVLAFDEDGVLRWLNPAAATLLLASPQRPAIRQHAKALGIAGLLDAKDGQVAGVAGRQWMVRRSRFREGGVPHELFLLSDVSAALREEERQAWGRLIRVLGHEINNSLTPIKSLAGSLRELARRGASTHEFDRPLEIIEDRADSLNRFLTAYRQWAQLPPPQRVPLALGPLLEQIAGLEARVPVLLSPGPPVHILADRDQLSQALINLLRNAVEAALENTTAPPTVQLRWFCDGSDAVISIRDSGLGIANPSNLFVPFYTTKESGTGIGLVLVKAIIEAHGGSVCLQNHSAGGAEGELRVLLAKDPEFTEPASSQRSKTAIS